MHGLMMDFPLTLDVILRRASTVHGEKEIVSRRADGSLHRTTYAELEPRVRRVAAALAALGVQRGERVATFAWNSWRHLELYFAIPCSGAVLHTLNVRLAPAQIAHIVRHAEDRVVFVDRSLAAAFAPVAAQCPGLRIVVMDDERCGDAQGIEGALDYEQLLERTPPLDAFPQLDERDAAGLCYTSGTTGEPKGVLYSHRAYVLHSFGGGMLDSMAVSGNATVLPVVPMFHANAWGFPFTGAFVGAKLVLPGAQLTGDAIADLVERERVTLAAGVPTIWNLVLQSLRKRPRDVTSLKSLVIGGSAAPAALIRAWRDEHGVEVTHAWGMTETTPVGICTRLKPATLAESADEQIRARCKQGVPVPGVEVRIEDESGRPLPWDGVSVGELAVRGPWVARAYFRDEAQPQSFTAEGWFRTGDVATIDARGYVEICDRKKDLIKSRGEWISSVALENCAMAFPGVLEAAVCARPDGLRCEVPVLWFAAADPQRPPSAAELVAHLAKSFERWQLPRAEDVRLVDAVPKTGVGKFDKKALRKRLADERASEARPSSTRPSSTRPS